MTNSPTIGIPTDIPTLIAELEPKLTTVILALTIGVGPHDDAVIRSLHEGTSEPTEGLLSKLNLAYEIFFALAAQATDESTALRRFMTQVQQFGGRSYLGAIRDGLDPDLIRCTIKDCIPSSG